MIFLIQVHLYYLSIPTDQPNSVVAVDSRELFFLRNGKIKACGSFSKVKCKKVKPPPTPHIYLFLNMKPETHLFRVSLPCFRIGSVLV